jgi:uncharacterized protein YqgC (DUF456 family)
MDWSIIFRIVGVILLDIALIVGLIAIPLGLSGNFIILGLALITAIATGFQAIGWVALLIMAAAVVIGEVVESFMGVLMARKFGATKWGMSGAFLGGLGGAILGGIIGAAVGTFIVPVIGTIIGSFVGTALGAVLLELARGSSREKGTRAGMGAFLGKVLASAFKMAIGIGMVVYIVIQTH